MRGTADKNIKPVSLIPPDAHATNAGLEGTGVDCKGFRELLVVVHCGAFTATGDIRVKLQESSDDGVADTYADITGADFTNLDTNEDGTLYVGRVNLEIRERYIRAHVVIADDVADFGVIGILSEAKILPVTQVNTAKFSV